MEVLVQIGPAYPFLSSEYLGLLIFSVLVRAIVLSLNKLHNILMPLPPMGARIHVYMSELVIPNCRRR
ncbi:hypothetical protein BOTBODRAFT_318424 [Botryobasidium botryosum FD-172 SS1]|uniref:Uncharacterized protein n=1 Tax=Botryobasidium botryosum (strain FD-172 SS1) TaxID=930990 RepID=A0A067NAI1_BOTB1|nr:hypothetical protein BOTBODRAFT_318424 [Botryobasidium botryosum FD-172 SS1]